MTDSNQNSWSQTVYVSVPYLSPASVTTCVGVSNTFVLMNAPGKSKVTWEPAGMVSPDTRTNTVVFSYGGNLTVKATYGGCDTITPVTSVMVILLTADSTNLCSSGTIVYTATTHPAGNENVLSWGDEALPGSGAKRTNTYSSLGPHVVSVSCGTSMKKMTSFVYGVSITPTSQVALADAIAPVAYSLTNSYGSASWQVSPSGPSFAAGNVGMNVLINPGSVSGIFNVIASSTEASSCTDTAKLEVVKVTFNTNLIALCENGSTKVSFTVQPTNYIGAVTIDTVTNFNTGNADTHANVTVSEGTNVTINGIIAGTAYLRARLGNSTNNVATLKIVRATFPTNAWYVKYGGSASFGVTLVPPDAPVVYESANTAVATVTGSGTNVSVTGIAPGTTQVRVRAGTNAPCSMKDVTVVRVQFSTNSIFLCNSNCTSLSVSVTPPTAPVVYSVQNANVLTLSVSGTNLTVCPRTGGSSIIDAKIGADVYDWCLVRGIRIAFPTNDWFALRGTPQVFACTVSPLLFASGVSFTISNATTATLAAAPPRLTVTGLSNGTAQIYATVSPSQSCASKSVTIFSAQLQSIEFTSDHNLICDGTSVTNAGSRYPNIEWDPSATPPNAPMTHTAGTNINVSVSLNMMISGLPTGTTFLLGGVSSEAAFTFAATNAFSGAATSTLPVQALAPLGREIRKIQADITWNLSISGNTLALGSSGPHTVYTTLGTPITNAPSGASIPNPPRMDIAADRMKKAIAWTNAPDAYTCYPRIVWRIVASGGGYTLTNNLPGVTSWLLPWYPADCISISRFVRNVCMVEGLPGQFGTASIGALYRTAADPLRPTKAFPGGLTASNGVPNVYPGTHGTPLTTGLATNWFLALEDRGGGINSFEAAVAYADTQTNVWFFPAGVGGDPHYDNPDSVVQIFKRMVWVEFVDHDGNTNTEPIKVIRAEEYIYTRQPDVELCPP